MRDFILIVCVVLLALFLLRKKAPQRAVSGPAGAVVVPSTLPGREASWRPLPLLSPIEPSAMMAEEERKHNARYGLYGSGIVGWNHDFFGWLDSIETLTMKMKVL